MLDLSSFRQRLARLSLLATVLAGCQSEISTNREDRAPMPQAGGQMPQPGLAIVDAELIESEHAISLSWTAAEAPGGYAIVVRQNAKCSDNDKIVLEITITSGTSAKIANFSET